MVELPQYFQHFKNNISGIGLPEKFTFPFFYEPHELSIIAAQELQDYLNEQSDWEHNFGITQEQEGLAIGKMFGVLVVQNQQGNLGYLAAFSGKLADSNQHIRFVPPVFDMLTDGSFFTREEKNINTINANLLHLENSEEYNLLKKELKKVEENAERDIQIQKQFIKSQKKKRNSLREAEILKLNPSDFEHFTNELNKESQLEKIKLNNMQRYWKHQLHDVSIKLNEIEFKIQNLKEQRSQKSAILQQQLFDSYNFANQYIDYKNLNEIFEYNPPAGAGECAAPKLLHYAFHNQLKPIAMAEFWWGQSPKSEIRKHGHFYPACTGKCEPILKHMLQGIEIDENPFLKNPAQGKELEIVFEDNYLLVINKPSEFLSVPGKNVTDSVSQRLKFLYPEATGPLIVHRLDMSTSGLILAAKSSEIYKKLQLQFIKRTIKKRYVALLDGVVKNNQGVINLPLRVDLDNRPNQLVCFEYGKAATTQWEVIERSKNTTKVYFYPITGRTHQLRVHAAHSEGLNSPIVGDDLYGSKADRLYLHAEHITFIHPVTNQEITIHKEAEF